MQIRWYVWVNVVAFVGLVFVAVFGGVGGNRTKQTEVPSAFSMEHVPRSQIVSPTTSTSIEPLKPQWPECSLPLYPSKVAASRRFVSDTQTEIVYETHWGEGIAESDHDEFVARAKRWTPECRMNALKKACSPHCIYGDNYAAIIDASSDVSEGKALLGAVLAINEAELKHARAVFVKMQKFAAYAKTVTPHSVSTTQGRECWQRMGRDHIRVDELQKQTDSRFANTVIGSVFGYARMCTNCDESTSHQRDCTSLSNELARGDKVLRDAEKELAEMRKLMNRK